MATQRNYAQQMDAVLAGLGGTRPRLLLHACCGPCSSAVLEQLCRYFEITVLYYNPNTWPAAEYYRRGEELQKFVAAAHPLGVTVVEDTYDPQQFYTAVAGLENEPERGSRCTVCYRLRMRRAAHPQPVADGAAAAALRLVFQPGYGGVELLRVVSVLHHGHPQRVGCRHELLQLLAPAVILCRRPCVGVIVQHRDLKIPAQLFQHGAGTGAAAGVEQKARAGTAKACQHGVHLLGIVALCCHWYHPLL